MSEAHDGTAEAAPEDTAAALDTGAEDQTQAQGDEQSGEDAAAAEEGEGQAERPKPKPSAQERISELTAARRQAERDRDFYREQFEQAQRGRQPADEAHQPTEDAEPDPANYEHGELDARFIREHATYHATKTFREEQAKAESQNRARSALQTFDQRAAEQFPEGEPDGLAKLRSLPKLSFAIQEVLFDSEIGPKLADHLGSNPRELSRISALSPLQQARELTKLELKLASPPAPTAKTATDAPTPTPTVRGSGGRFTVAADTEDFAAFQKGFGG